jgi:hypothetical protein
VDARDSEAYYFLGVIRYDQAFTAIEHARLEEKMEADDLPPLKDTKTREALRLQYEHTIGNALANLAKCLSIDAGNEDAMEYMSLLLREKAFLENSSEASRADIAEAEAWASASREMKRLKTNSSAKGPRELGPLSD